MTNKHKKRDKNIGWTGIKKDEKRISCVCYPFPVSLFAYRSAQTTPHIPIKYWNLQHFPTPNDFEKCPSIPGKFRITSQSCNSGIFVVKLRRDRLLLAVIFGSIFQSSIRWNKTISIFLSAQVFFSKVIHKLSTGLWTFSYKMGFIIPYGVWKSFNFYIIFYTPGHIERFNLKAFVLVRMFYGWMIKKRETNYIGL